MKMNVKLNNINNKVLCQKGPSTFRAQKARVAKTENEQA